MKLLLDNVKSLDIELNRETFRVGAWEGNFKNMSTLTNVLSCLRTVHIVSDWLTVVLEQTLN